MTLSQTTQIGSVAPASAFDRISKAVTTVDEVFDQVLEELAWMDIPVLVLKYFYVHTGREQTSMRHSGALMHLIHTWDTHALRWGDDNQLYAEPADSCICTPGTLYKYNGRRREFVGEYRIVGVRGEQVYLAPAQPDIDTDRVKEIQQMVETDRRREDMSVAEFVAIHGVDALPPLTPAQGAVNA